MAIHILFKLFLSILIYNLYFINLVASVRRPLYFSPSDLFIEWRSGHDTYFFCYNFRVNFFSQNNQPRNDLRFSLWQVLRLQSSGI